MSEMQVQLATLNGSVISPVYSWVTPFQNYIAGGLWTEACGSDKVKQLDFDNQMRNFINVKVESECCQKYGICGEQFVSDVSFDKNGKVSSTRFRFQHTPVQYQDDFIRDLVLTRRVADLFSAKLIQNKKDPDVKSQLEFQDDVNNGLISSLSSKLGLNSLFGKKETEAPSAFTYSLFYVFYDQYTYIRGVLSQNALLGVAAVILSL